MKTFETDRAASSARKAYSTMYITVLVQRQSGWFVKNVFLLIGLLLMYDWFTFLLAPVGCMLSCSIANLVENVLLNSIFLIVIVVNCECQNRTKLRASWT